MSKDIERMYELQAAVNKDIEEFNINLKEYAKNNSVNIQGIKPPVPQEFMICANMPNDLHQAKRFYKTRPSWKKTPFNNTRNPAYYKYCTEHIENDGLWLEFGVKAGKSARIISKIKREDFPNIETPLYGFDSFIGLPEDTEWGHKGHLSVDGEIPKIDGASFIKGWFSDTIPEFNNEHGTTPLAFLHIDCDIYTSTVTVLEGMKDRIVPGTVVLFDDMLSYSQNSDLWVGEEHEFKAFMEFVEKYDVEYEWLAYVLNASQIACKIKKIN